jgi:MoaA/NifB/PqqE/SkfB family radical SAM enzyme
MPPATSAILPMAKCPRKDLRWIDPEQFDRALDILHQRNVHNVSFFGGETLLHPRLADMVAMAVARGMGPAVITNGWLLPAKIDRSSALGVPQFFRDHRRQKKPGAGTGPAVRLA